MRTFVAIPIDAELRARLAEVRRTLEGSGADVRWVAPELLHVTLKFLGELDEAAADRVVALTAERAREVAPFELRFTGVRPFPGGRRPRIVAAHIDAPPPGLFALAAALDPAYAELGVASDDRAFLAHLTLGRVRSARGLGELLRALGELAGVALGRVRVPHVQVVKSVLGPGGPRYTVLAAVPLGGSPSAVSAGTAGPLAPAAQEATAAAAPETAATRLHRFLTERRVAELELPPAPGCPRTPRWTRASSSCASAGWGRCWSRTRAGSWWASSPSATCWITWWDARPSSPSSISPPT